MPAAAKNVPRYLYFGTLVASWMVKPMILRKVNVYPRICIGIGTRDRRE